MGKGWVMVRNARVKIHFLPLQSVAAFTKTLEQPFPIGMQPGNFLALSSLVVRGCLQHQRETWHKKKKLKNQFSSCLCKPDFTLVNGDKCCLGLPAHTQHFPQACK